MKAFKVVIDKKPFMEDVIAYHVNNEVKVWLSERVRHRLYAKGRARRGDFSMVLTRLARFALPRVGYGGSKRQTSSLSQKSRAKRDH